MEYVIAALVIGFSGLAHETSQIAEGLSNNPPTLPSCSISPQDVILRDMSPEGSGARRHGLRQETNRRRRVGDAARYVSAPVSTNPNPKTVEPIPITHYPAFGHAKGQIIHESPRHSEDLDGSCGSRAYARRSVTCLSQSGQYQLESFDPQDNRHACDDDCEAWPQSVSDHSHRYQPGRLWPRRSSRRRQRNLRSVSQEPHPG